MSTEIWCLLLGGGGRKEEEELALIESTDPHLAGGEKCSNNIRLLGTVQFMQRMNSL